MPAAAPAGKRRRSRIQHAPFRGGGGPGGWCPHTRRGRRGTRGSGRGGARRRRCGRGEVAVGDQLFAGDGRHEISPRMWESNSVRSACRARCRRILTAFAVTPNASARLLRWSAPRCGAAGGRCDRSRGAGPWRCASARAAPCVHTFCRRPRATARSASPDGGQRGSAAAARRAFPPAGASAPATASDTR